MMDGAARDDALAATREDMDRVLAERQERQRVARSLGVYPLVTPGSSTEVTVHNCWPAVIEFTAKVMRQSPQPEEHLLEFSTDDPPQLLKMHVPTHGGWIEIGEEEVQQHWQEFYLQDVEDQAALKKFNSKDLAIRRFAVAMIALLQKHGAMDNHINPTPEALEQTAKVCRGLETVTPLLKLRVVASAARLTPVTSVVRCTTLTNFKGALNQWVQQNYKGFPTGSILKFHDSQTAPNSQIFVTTCVLELPSSEVHAVLGDPAGKKKEAQQLAAKKMIDKLNAANLWS